MPPSGANMLEKLGVVPARHPRAGECDHVVTAWLERHSGLGGRVSERKRIAWKFASLCSDMFPDSELELTALAACFTHWIAVVDDVVESEPKTTAELRRVHETRNGGEEWGPVVEAWCDIESRLTAGTDESFSERVSAARGRLFDAYAWEARVRAERRLPTLEELVTYRHASGGLPLYLLILERSVGGPLPAHIVTASWFGELSELSGNLTCFANDLLSFEWDRSANNPMNLTRVLSGGAEPNYEAVERYYLEQWRRMLALSAAARERVPRDSSASRYVDALPALVAGVFTWMDETGRYASAS
jgi:hypothetical protein